MGARQRCVQRLNMALLHGSTCMLLGALLAACSTAVPAPASHFDLTVEEHRLVEAPSFEPLTFTPAQGTMDSILAAHAAQRSLTIPRESLLIDGRHAQRAVLGDDILIATEHFGGSDASSWVSVARNDQEIYRIDTGMPGPLPGLQGLWTYDDHWVLETAYITSDSHAGRLSIDGTLRVPRGGLDQAFDFQLLHGRPFYFLSKLGRIGFHFDGREVPSGYDEVPHYQCCSASALNPLHAEDMLAFFARRGPVWYYVEIGVYHG